MTVERACIDYGVVVKEVDAELAEYELDEAATEKERKRIGNERAAWLEEDAARCSGAATRRLRARFAWEAAADA